MATGFADGTLFEYEYVNTGEKFFYAQDPSSDTIVHDTGLKWLARKTETHQSALFRSQVARQAPLRTKGNEFQPPVVYTMRDKNQKTLDDYVTK
jgi:hypothetical protein